MFRVVEESSIPYSFRRHSDWAFWN